MEINDCLSQYFTHLKEFCPELTQEELDEFGKGLTVTKLDKNFVYINEGEVQKQAGFVIKGLMREFYVDDMGNEKNTNFIAENQYAFNYPYFMEKLKSPFSYQCLEPTILINLPINHIHNAYKNPKFERYGRLRAERTSRIQRERLHGLLSKSALQRYKDFVNENPILNERITVSHLSSYLGVKRQTLTRIRKKIILKK